jgi:hypothetical protein
MVKFSQLLDWFRKSSERGSDGDDLFEYSERAVAGG